jgi:bidirectional [NiFe] hydrogenase diaphorase subunit
MADRDGIADGEAPDAIEQALQRHGLRRDGLIEVLTAAQRQDGWLKPTVLSAIATRLELPLSQVLGTASFYHLFRFQPPLPHRCLVCTGTACHVLGAPQLMATLKHQPLEQSGVELGVVRCIGSCSGAPLVVIDGQVLNHQSPASALQAVQALIGAQP